METGCIMLFIFCFMTCFGRFSSLPFLVNLRCGPRWFCFLCCQTELSYPVWRPILDQQYRSPTLFIYRNLLGLCSIQCFVAGGGALWCCSCIQLLISIRRRFAVPFFVRYLLEVPLNAAKPPHTQFDSSLLICYLYFLGVYFAWSFIQAYIWYVDRCLL